MSALRVARSTAAIGARQRLPRRALSEAKTLADYKDPTKTKGYWKEWSSNNKQGFFNVGVTFAVCVLASQNLGAKQQRDAVERELDDARAELEELKVTDAAALAPAAARLKVAPAALSAEMGRVVNPPPRDASATGAGPSIV